MNRLPKATVRHWAYKPRTPYHHQELVQDYLNHLSASHGPTVLMKCRGVCRHFVVWLFANDIVPRKIDRHVVKQFLSHSCSCHGYTQASIRKPHYVEHLTRFVRFLENRSVVPKPSVSVDIPALIPVFGQSRCLRNLSESRRRLHLNEAQHFAWWIDLSRVSWSEISRQIVNRYVGHKCVCPLKRRRGTLAASGQARRWRVACMFLSFLYRNEHLSNQNPDRSRFLLEAGYQFQSRFTPPTPEEVLTSAYRKWLIDQMGNAPRTVKQYTKTVRKCLRSLGSDPTTYTPTKIRNFILDVHAERTPVMVKHTAKGLRSFLRFLSFQDRIPQHYVNSIPTVHNSHKNGGLPKYASPKKIEQIIASCSRETPIRIRDRAIVLLLARLGLRAADVVSLRLDSIDWNNASLAVYGKARRPALLPLPQDVGDALLDYIETARPRVAEHRVFLTGNPPHRPFGSSGSIRRVVKQVLERAGIEDVPSGTHMFRHSLATMMLRSGSDLETVGAILRHKSPTTTRVYAKVNVPMLMSVAQPWPGDAKC